MSGIEILPGGSPLTVIGAAFAGGVLVSLSPCVYPLIPPVAAYVGSRTAGEKTRWQAFRLSLAYVLGLAAVYSLLGLAAALTGGFFGQVAASPWALLAVANVFLLLALNILEVVPFPAWYGRGSRETRGGVAGAFLVGAAAGLVASPCTSPVLFGLLTFVATTGEVVYGAALLFAFSLGMGCLLLAVGTFSGLAAALPKPGRWMVWVKRALGVLMLGLAEYYLVKAGQAWF